LRASRIKLAALSILAFVCLVALSVVVAAVWFGYAVAHSKKDIWSDLTVILLTGLPFYVVSYTLWRMAKRFQSALSVEAAQPDVSADAPQVVRRRSTSWAGSLVASLLGTVRAYRQNET
jgi:hypothetical protein